MQAKCEANLRMRTPPEAKPEPPISLKLTFRKFPYKDLLLFILAFAFTMKRMFSLQYFVVFGTENIKSEKKNQNKHNEVLKALPFDMYLLFGKILKANLCFGTNFP